MTKRLEDAIKAINKLNKSELQHLNSTAIKDRFDHFTSREANAFMVGDKVTFEARGDTFKGRVKKVNRKSLQVETKGNGTWNISPCFAKAV